MSGGVVSEEVVSEAVEAGEGEQLPSCFLRRFGPAR
jgi:hypothetical protein